MIKKHLFVSLEHRFYEYEGLLYTKLAFNYNYWNDYLQFFEQVTVIARVEKVEFWDEKFVRVDGGNVDFIGIPYYIGPSEFISKLFPILKKLNQVSKLGCKFLLRSGNISNLLWILLMLRRKTYIREYPGNVKLGVIGFTGDSFINRFFAQILHLQAKLHAYFSAANSFVSSDCKNIYSTKKTSYIFSSFNSDEITIQKETYQIQKNIFKVVMVGRLEGEKGHSDALLALKILSKSRVNEIEITIIGDGSKKNELVIMAEQMNLNVNFTGAITNRNELFREISKNDLYLIPSHTEGMPRSLLESMAIGMPCVGSNVGGIPEVLDRDCLFEARNVESISNLVSAFAVNEEMRAKFGKANQNLIRELYSLNVLNEKKHKFWGALYE